MPERKAQQRLTRIITDIRSRKFPYKPKPAKRIDWAAYDAAQLNEMNDYLTLVREVVDEIHREIGDVDQGNVGKPPKSAFDRAKAVLLQQYFEAGNRVAAGLARLFAEKLGIAEPLGYKDIETAYENAAVVLILGLVLAKTNEPVREQRLAGDGTGVPSSIKENYANDRGTPRAQHYDKLITIVGVEHKLIAAAEFADGHAAEGEFAIPLMEEARRLHPEARAVALDGAFYWREIIAWLEKEGITPYIMPLVTATLNARGCPARRRMLKALLKDVQAWLAEYHVRSITESRHSADKRVFPRPALKRIEGRRRVEGFARACRYNIRQLAYVHYLNKVPVQWLERAAG